MQKGRELVLNLGALVYIYFVILLAEHKEDYQRADNGARLNDPEHTGLALVKKEVGEIEIRRFCEQYGGRIAHKRGRALEVGRDGNADNARHGRDVELFAKRELDGRYHENGSDIVDKRGDDAREKAHADDSPLDIGHL